MRGFSRQGRCPRAAAVQIGPSACSAPVEKSAPLPDIDLPFEVPPPVKLFIARVDNAIASARALGASLVALPAHIGTFLYNIECQNEGSSEGSSNATSGPPYDGPAWPEVAAAASTGRIRVWNSGTGSYEAVDVVDTYMRLFSRAAAKHQVYLVGGTLLSAPEGTESSGSAPAHLLNRGYLFGPDGTLIGSQAQTHLTQEEKVLGFGRGESLSVFQTDIGTIGMAIGRDVWIPEVARILSLMGADIIVCPVAVEAPYSPWHQVRGIWQEVQQNQVFGIEACLVGKMFERTYEGRSAILTSVEASEDGSGFLAHVADPARELASDVGSALPPHVPAGGSGITCDGDGAAGVSAAADDAPGDAPSAAPRRNGPRTQCEAVLVADLSYERLEAARRTFPVFAHFNCGLYKRRMPQVYGGGSVVEAGIQADQVGSKAGPEGRG